MTALVAAAAMLLLLPCGAVAQDSTVVADSLSADSLAARLGGAEAAIALLREQLATQAGSAVQTRSRAHFELFGRALTNAFANNRRVSKWISSAANSRAAADDISRYFGYVPHAPS